MVALPASDTALLVTFAAPLSRNPSQFRARCREPGLWSGELCYASIDKAVIDVFRRWKGADSGRLFRFRKEWNTNYRPLRVQPEVIVTVTTELFPAEVDGRLSVLDGGGAARQFLLMFGAADC